ncbi:MAG: SUMF1/EgtB/PvdO family nonheme iron enzyme [Candidatus Omnitrophica bacterium]|nr:SUMF1/EgtB/PvdO family nonheme iron enzyme [Candidatus Omnitrophota bacterium]
MKRSTFFLLFLTCLIVWNHPLYSRDVSAPADAYVDVASLNVSPNTVEAYDDEASEQPLAGTTDFDQLDDRKIVVRWNYTGGEAIKDWHVYFKKGDGGFFYLDRTRSGSSSAYTWINPDVNIQYQLRVWGIKEAGGLVVLSQKEPFGYNLAGGDEIKLKTIANPDDIPEETAIVTDDLFHGTDLSGASDTDSLMERALAVKFNPGELDIFNTHIYASTDGATFDFLGQTGAEDLYFFRFDGNQTFSQDEKYIDGPQDGVSYWFRVFCLINGGGSFRMEAGPVDFFLDDGDSPSDPNLKPDIVILNFYTERTASNPEGDAFVVNVANQGSARAGSFKVIVQEMSETVHEWQVGGLDANQSIELRLADAGAGFLPERTAVADPENAIAELDETNNSFVASFDVWPTPTPNNTPTPNITPTPTITPTATTTPTPVFTFPPTPTPTLTPTLTPSPTEAPVVSTPTMTETPTAGEATPTGTEQPPSPTPISVEPTSTPTLMEEPPSPTPIPEPTDTPEPTATATTIPTPTPTLDESTVDQLIEIDLPEQPSDSLPLQLAWIPSGSFSMGSPLDEVERYEDEVLHNVTFTIGFYMGKYEITQSQWEAVMGSNPSYYAGNPDNPVENVSWYDCAQFCNALSALEGLTPVYDENSWQIDRNANGFRLPSETEWEYACRAGTTTRFYWGDSGSEIVMKQYCWYEKNADEGFWTNPHAEVEGAQQAGLKKPNAWGLYDMSGNVWEWCQDRYADYPAGDVVDPVSQESGLDRIIRGGSWLNYSYICRSAYRDYWSPDAFDFDTGFRIVRPYR